MYLLREGTLSLHAHVLTLVDYLSHQWNLGTPEIPWFEAPPMSCKSDPGLDHEVGHGKPRARGYSRASPLEHPLWGVSFYHPWVVPLRGPSLMCGVIGLWLISDAQTFHGAVGPTKAAWKAGWVQNPTESNHLWRFPLWKTCHLGIFSQQQKDWAAEI